VPLACRETTSSRRAIRDLLVRLQPRALQIHPNICTAPSPAQRPWRNSSTPGSRPSRDFSRLSSRNSACYPNQEPRSCSGGGAVILVVAIDVVSSLEPTSMTARERDARQDTRPCRKNWARPKLLSPIPAITHRARPHVAASSGSESSRLIAMGRQPHHPPSGRALRRSPPPRAETPNAVRVHCASAENARSQGTLFSS